MFTYHFDDGLTTGFLISKTTYFLIALRLHHKKGGLPMDLVQLEHFLAIADERTFTRAAERVFRTQPALSQSIKKLETELGSPLFVRDNGNVSLTEAGNLLADIHIAC
jgi:hypothetical protein